MTRVVLGLLAAVLAAIIAARLVHLATTRADTGPVPQPWAQDRMEFVAWNGELWTAWIRDERFELRPQVEGKWRRHANVTLAFIGWKGQPWQAKIEADEFLLARRGDWKADTERAGAIRYRDWRGDPQLRTVAQLRR